MDADDAALGQGDRHGSAGGVRSDGDQWWLDDVIPVRSSLGIVDSATAPNATVMRRTFADWLALDILAGELFDDLVLAVYEAIANVVDHAYAGTPDAVGTVRLTADRTRDHLFVAVADAGQWRSDTGTPFRNRGLLVIREIVGQVHVEAGPSGTVVYLQSPLPLPGLTV